MASSITNRIQSNFQSISDKLNAISSNALLRCLSNFRRAHPLLFWLLSPMIVPAASCLVFVSSIILSGIVFLAIFYGILFLLFLPTLLVVLSGPTMLAVCIICTCYIFYQGFLFVQGCVRIVKRAPQIARQFYTRTLERVVWFLAMDNGNPFTNQQWITLWNEFSRRVQVFRENFVTFPRVVTAQQIFMENYQMAKEKTEEARRLFHQVVEYGNGLLAFPRQVGNTIQTIASTVLMSVYFVVTFPKRMMDSIVTTYRQLLSIMTQVVEACRSITVKINTVALTIYSAVQSIPGYPRRMMDRIGCIYKQGVSVMTTIVGPITTLVSTVSTAIQTVLYCARQVTDKILFTYSRVVSIVLQVHQLLQCIAAYCTRMMSATMSAVHLLTGVPTLIIDRLVLIYRQVVSILIRVDQLYQSIVANITAIVSTIISTVHVILTIPRTVRDDVVHTYRQVVSVVMYVHQLYQTMSDKIVTIYRLIVSIITTTYRIVSFMVSIPRQVWTFFSEKTPKERLQDQVREIERQMAQIVDRFEGRVTRVIQETRNTNIINVNITNPALLPEPQIRDTGVTVTDSFHPRERDVYYDALCDHVGDF